MTKFTPLFTSDATEKTTNGETSGDVHESLSICVINETWEC